MRHKLAAAVVLTVLILFGFFQSIPEAQRAAFFGISINGAKIGAGTSSPEGALAGNVGDLYIQKSNGSIWTKTSGTGTTGWTQIGAGTVTGSLTSPRIPYASSSSALADAAGLAWNNTSKTLTLATAGQTLDAPDAGAQLHIGGDFDGGSSSGHAHVVLDAYGNVPSLTFRRANGTQASKTAPGSGVNVLNLRSQAWDGSAFNNGGFLRFFTDGTQSGTNRGQNFQVWLTANGSTSAPTERLRVSTDAITFGANPATTGIFRIPNATSFYARNNTNTADIQLIGTSASNAVSIGDVLRVNQIGEMWETEPSNGDFRPGTSNARDLGGSSRIIRTSYINRESNPTQVITTTGTENALAVTSSLLRINNATDLTVNGIAAGVDGQLLSVYAVGVGNVFFSHNSGSAAAGDKILNMVTTAATPLAAGKGRATFRYSTSSSAWILMDHEQGAFIAETFNAGDFTANGSMTWTVASGDVGVSSYYIKGRTMFWTFRYSTTTVGGTPNTLLHKLAPLGVTIALAFDGTFYAEDNGTKTTGWFLNNTNTGISFAKLAGGNWTASTDATKIAGQLVFGIV